MKISIVTPSFNQGKYIKDCIESILSQQYEEFEHIVMDGGSTDDTIKILKSYPHIKWESKPDNGPAEALMKGFRIASGDVFTWLNSDDYYDKNVFKTIYELYNKETRKDFIYIIGNLTFVDKNKNVLFKDKTHRYDKEYLISQSADVIRQPSSFFSSNLFKKVGGINESLQCVFDYELFIKFLEKTNPVFIDQNFVFQRDYPETISRKFMRQQAIEIFKVSNKYGGKFFSRLNKTNLKKIIFKKL